jgi:hypothetical protein
MKCSICGCVINPGDPDVPDAVCYPCSAEHPELFDAVLDWQPAREHGGLQAVAFPEVDTRPVQGALL